MSIILNETEYLGVVSGDGTKTLVSNRTCWHNQLIVKAGTATAGTLTISYTVGGATFALKDSGGTAVTVDLSAATAPILFDGLVDSVIVAQSGVNGTFDITLLGSQ